MFVNESFRRGLVPWIVGRYLESLRLFLPMSLRFSARHPNPWCLWQVQPYRATCFATRSGTESDTENPYEQPMNTHTYSDQHQGHSLWKFASGCTFLPFLVAAISYPHHWSNYSWKNSRKKHDIRTPSKNWRFSIWTGEQNFFHQNHKVSVLPLTGIGGAKARQEPPSEALPLVFCLIAYAKIHLSL